MAGKTVFFTYLLGDASVTGGTAQGYTLGASFGYSAPLHCNYIQKLEASDLTNKTISIIVPDGTLFPFMKDSSEIAINQDGEGWSASKFFGIVQIVDGTGSTVTPDPNAWKIVNLTPQLDGYSFWNGQTIPRTAFNSGSIVTIKIADVTAAPIYTLSYLNYPSALSIDNSKLAFGEEAFFFGNVRTEMKAIAYTTDISVVLPLNQYNSTTNKSWDSVSPVQITEVGVFDNNNNLVAVGKLNNPIEKDSTIFRTVQFSLDF